MSPTSLADALRAVNAAIAGYNIQVVSMLDPGGPSDTPAYRATLALVRAALLPLDEYRENQARNAARGAADPEPAEAPPAETPAETPAVTPKPKTPA